MTHTHLSEEALIDFAIGSQPDRVNVAAHLAICEHCRESLEAIRHVQFVLRNESIPVPDVESHWTRLHSQLRSTTTAREKKERHWWKWLAIAIPCTLAILLVIMAVPRRQHPVNAPDTSILSDGRTDADPSGQLAGIERLLILVRHTDGPLDGTIRSEAGALLERNEACIKTADSKGQVGVAQVLQNSGYLLSTIAHFTGTSDDMTSRNTELNLDGTLLQLRILLQNAAISSGGGRTS